MLLMKAPPRSLSRSKKGIAAALRTVGSLVALSILTSVLIPYSAKAQTQPGSKAPAGSNGSTGALDTVPLRLKAGAAHLQRADLSAALEAYEQAATNAREIGRQDFLAESLSGLGLVYKRLGDYYQALTLYSQALGLCRKAGDSDCEAELLHNIGVCYTLLGELQAAKEVLGDALEAWSSEYDRSATLTALATIYGLEGDHERAIDQLRRAFVLRHAEPEEDMETRVRGKATTLDRLATAYRDAGRMEEARKAYEAALRVWQSVDDPLGVAQTNDNLGWLYVEQHRPEVALRHFEQAVARFHDLDLPHEHAHALLGRAHARRQLGDLQAATIDIEQAVGIIEMLRSNSYSPLLRASFLARRQPFYELYIAVLMQQYEASLDARFVTRALEVAERFKARGLLDLLHEKRAVLRQRADRQQAQVDELHREMNALEHQRLGLLHSRVRLEEVAEVEKAQRDVVLRYDKLRMQIPNPHSDPSAPQPLHPWQMRDLLDEDTVLLVYSLGEERSFVWMMDQEKVISHPLPGRHKIEALARKSYDWLLSNDRRGDQKAGEEAASQLRELVVGCVEGSLGNKRLVVVADGWLHYIPFAALPAGDSSPLILDHEIVTLPSVSVLAALRRRSAERKRAPQQVAVIADPVFGPDDPRLGVAAASTARRNSSAIPPPERLQYSANEAEVILGLALPGQSYSALGFDATRQKVLGGDLHLYRIIHFAVHAELRDEQPEFTHLMLSFIDPRGQPQDGRLFLHELDELELPAELVVLSACKTALGPHVEGEGVMNMTRSLMDAGASRVLVSLWQVSDEATAQLMAKLYRELLINDRTPAAALRSAQIWLRSTQRWHAPYYWAGFALQGEWR